MYSIRPRKTKFKVYPDIKKLDKRKHAKCHPGDPDAFRITRVVELDAGGEYIWYEYYKPKKGIKKEDSALNDYVKSKIKEKKKNGK